MRTVHFCFSLLQGRAWDQSSKSADQTKGPASDRLGLTPRTPKPSTIPRKPMLPSYGTAPPNRHQLQARSAAKPAGSTTAKRGPTRHPQAGPTPKPTMCQPTIGRPTAGGRQNRPGRPHRLRSKAQRADRGTPEGERRTQLGATVG